MIGTVDLCVVNFNTREKLQRLCCELLSDSEPHWRPWRLYIADNGSTDGSADWLKEYHSSYEIEHVSFNENVGYAAACNQLASYGTGEIIGLLNADVWLATSDIQKIQAAFRDKEVSVLGPKQRDEQGSIVHAGIFGTNEAPKHRGWRQYDPSDQLYRDKQECVTISGSAYFVRRTAWDTLTQCKIYQSVAPGARGAFLPTPHFYEETWCSYHAWKHGLKVFYDGSISIGHSWHASSPVGSQNDKFAISRQIFRAACDTHSITHD